MYVYFKYLECKTFELTNLNYFNIITLHVITGVLSTFTIENAVETFLFKLIR